MTTISATQNPIPTSIFPPEGFHYLTDWDIVAGEFLQVDRKDPFIDFPEHGVGVKVDGESRLASGDGSVVLVYRLLAERGTREPFEQTKERLLDREARFPYIARDRLPLEI